MIRIRKRALLSLPYFSRASFDFLYDVVQAFALFAGRIQRGWVKYVGSEARAARFHACVVIQVTALFHSVRLLVGALPVHSSPNKTLGNALVLCRRPVEERF